MDILINIFIFGEKIAGYDYKVLNERAIRASAGIMFLFGIISLFSVFMIHNMFWAELFSITFIVEFITRVLINPSFAPYMILGNFVVSNQSAEWVEAKPKKIAWIFGLLLGLIMAYFIIFDVMTPARLLVCVVCLILLFLESSFGICLGCIAYKKFKLKVQNCAGDICEINNRSKISLLSILLLTLFISFFYITYLVLLHKYEKQLNPISIENKILKNDCQVPQYAINMGHEKMWKKHHGCKN